MDPNEIQFDVDGNVIPPAPSAVDQVISAINAPPAPSPPWLPLPEVVAGATASVPDFAPEVITGNPIDGQDEIQNAFYAGQPNPERWNGVLEPGAISMESPDPVIPGAPLASFGVGQSQSSGGSVSRSTAGVPQAKQDAFYQQYLDQTKAAGQWAANGEAGDQDRLRKNALVEGQAAIEIGRAEGTHARNMEALTRRVADFEELNAELQLQNENEAKQHRAGLMSQYKEQLAGLRAMNATSGNPLGALGGGQAAAMGGALFAQGFLAAQGIQINVAGQIDKFVDRSIAEHQQKISNAREDLQGTQNLYAMVRQNSEDDYEARMRYRGFVMEAMKQQVQLEGFRFNSDVAKGRAMKALAAIDMEAMQHEQKLGTLWEDRRLARTEAARKVYEEQGKQAHQKEANSIAWSQAGSARMNAQTAKGELELKKQTAAKPAEGEMHPGFADPGATVRKDGKVIGAERRWRRLPGLSAGQVTALDTSVATQTALYQTLLGNVATLRKLKKPSEEGFVSKYGGSAGRERFNQAAREYEQARMGAVMGIRHAIAGANLTENEKREWDRIGALTSGWESGTNDRSLTLFENGVRNGFTAVMDSNPNLEKIPEGQRTVREYAGGDPNDTSAAFSAEFSEADTSTPVGQAESLATAQGHNEVELGGGYSGMFLEHMKRTGDKRGAGRTDNFENTAGQRQEIDAVDQLALLVLKPSDPQERTAALESIERLAKVSDEEVRTYARFAHQTLTDPWAAGATEELYRKFGSKQTLSDNIDPVAQDEAENPKPLGDMSLGMGMGMGI